MKIIARMCGGLLAALALTVAFNAAQAASPLQWTDISNHLTPTQNRPVWDIAYAAPYWYLTDGQALATGGHVWRTDGTWTKDITSDVKATGVARVDAIETDGSNIFFVNKTATAGVQFESELNVAEGTYASAVQTNTDASGITTQYPYLTFVDANGSCVIGEVSGASVDTKMLYTGADACLEGQVTASTWDGQAWLILANHKQLYRLSGSTLTNLGETRDYFTSMVSNGDGTIEFGGAVSKLGNSQPTSPLTAKLATVKETNFTPVPSAVGTTDWSWLEPSVASLGTNQKTSYNVGAWNAHGVSKIDMYVNGTLKTSCPTSGQTVNCSLPLNGADDTAGTTLDLKAGITDADGFVTWTNVSTLPITSTPGAVTNLGTATGTAITVADSVVPDQDYVSRYQTIDLSVQASAGNGLASVQIWNGNTLLTQCLFPGIIGTQTCDYKILGTDQPMGTVYTLNARAIDKNGKEAWGGVRTITFKDGDAGTAANTSGSLTSNGTTVNAAVTTPNGVKQIDLYVGDALKQTCVFSNGYGERNCAATLTATDPQLAASVSAKAVVTDIYGNTATVGPTQLALATASIATVTPTPAMQMDSNGIALTSTGDNGFDWTNPITIQAAALRTLGVDRIDILVNNQIAKSCGNLVAATQGSDATVTGIVKIWNAGKTDISIATGTTMLTTDGRAYVATQSVTAKSRQYTTLTVSSSGVGQSYDLSLGTTFVVQGLDVTDQNNLIVTATDGFANGRSSTPATDATCSVLVGPYSVNSLTYTARMLDSSGHVVVTESKTINKK